MEAEEGRAIFFRRDRLNSALSRRVPPQIISEKEIQEYVIHFDPFSVPHYKLPATKRTSETSTIRTLLRMQMRPKKFYPRICPFDVDGGRSKSHRRRQRRRLRRQVVLASAPSRQPALTYCSSENRDGGWMGGGRGGWGKSCCS